MHPRCEERHTSAIMRVGQNVAFLSITKGFSGLAPVSFSKL
jgi:hypothetical protein